jgi:hypothetical protein
MGASASEEASTETRRRFFVMADLLEHRGLEVRIIMDIRLKANFETETTLKINKLLVSFDSEIRRLPDIEIMRISE